MTIGAGISLFEMVTLFFPLVFAVISAGYQVKK
jgi:hypothetical protein